MWWALISIIKPPKASLRRWVVGSGLVLFGIMAWYGVRDLFPAPLPARLVWENDGLRADGKWYIEGELEITKACRLFGISRTFTGDSTAGKVSDLEIPAVDGSNPETLNALVIRSGTKPGRYHFWRSYVLPPGFHGFYNVQMMAGGGDECPSVVSFLLYAATVP